MKRRSDYLTLVVIAFFMWGLQGCRTLDKVIEPNNKKVVEALNKDKSRAKPKKRRRPRISTSRNRYEGSLWRDEASFGNLWRDHRARFRHDLLTINDLSAIVNVPPPKATPGANGQPQNAEEAAAVALEALSLRDTIEEEQNDILRSLGTMSAEVIRVLPNGNMVVRGRKVDHRQRNKIRYITTVQGILRPADVDDSNVVSATKLAYPEVKINRQIRGNLLRERLQKLSPLIGKGRASLLGRITEFSKAKK